MTSAGYPHTSIWRPGLLGRGVKARGVEKMARFLVTPVRDCRVFLCPRCIFISLLMVYFFLVVSFLFGMVVAHW